jgi:hypothetical protein
MKKAVRSLVVLWFLTLAGGARLNAAAKSLEEAITSNMWSWEYHDAGKDKKEPIRFSRDGVATNLKYFTAHWEIAGPHTLILRMHDMRAPLTFNEDFTRYEGIDFHGKIKVWGVPGERINPNEMAPAMQSAPSAAPATTGPTCIAILSAQAPNALEWALAPLKRNIPPDMRQTLTYLREDMLDEGAKKPAANAEAYRLGAHLCNELIGTLDERDKMLVRAGYTAVQSKVNMGEITNQALEARRRFTNWPTYQREKDQRDELRKEKQNAAALERQRPVMEWANRGDQIRKMVDLLYAQYREAARR